MGWDGVGGAGWGGVRWVGELAGMSAGGKLQEWISELGRWAWHMGGLEIRRPIGQECMSGEARERPKFANIIGSPETGRLRAMTTCTRKPGRARRLRQTLRQTNVKHLLQSSRRVHRVTRRHVLAGHVMSELQISYFRLVPIGIAVPVLA